MNEAKLKEVLFYITKNLADIAMVVDHLSRGQQLDIDLDLMKRMHESF